MNYERLLGNKQKVYVNCVQILQYFGKESFSVRNLVLAAFHKLHEGDIIGSKLTLNYNLDIFLTTTTNQTTTI